MSIFTPNFPQKLSLNDSEYKLALDDYFILVRRWDESLNDATAMLMSDIECSARLVANESGIIAGIEEVQHILKSFTNIHVNNCIADGESFDIGSTVLEIRGLSREIVSIERTILNLLGRMAGIATATSKFVQRLRGFYNPVQLLMTRKTVLGPLDKKAGVIGGAFSHRVNLKHAIVVKDNHGLATPLEEILSRIESVSYDVDFIEVEVDSAAGYKRLVGALTRCKSPTPFGIMFDNMKPLEMQPLLEDFARTDLSKSVFTEASGGISMENISAYDLPGLNFVSSGSLTNKSHAIDLSLELLIK